VIAICAIALSSVFQINKYEWIIIVFAIGFVFAMELMNTAIENIADFLSTDIDDRIKKIKDLSAAATFVSAIVALIIGVVVFLPKIIELIALN
jgi:diacylglycerol kinase